MKLLGVHVIGELASEVVHIGVVAMLSDSTAELFNRSCFNFPTLGDLYKIATYDAMVKRATMLDLALSLADSSCGSAAATLW